MKTAVYVIGLGVEIPPCLSVEAQDILDAAGLLIGGKRLLDLFPDHPAEKMTISSNFDVLLQCIREREEENIVILGSGDPGFHGIAGTLLKRLPKEDIRVIPNVSSLQVTFARAGVPWGDAVLVSVHAHSLDRVLAWSKRAGKLGILTDRQNTPAVIATALLDAGVDNCRAVVAENLGRNEEQIIDTTLLALKEMRFSPLNVMLVLQGEDWQPSSLWAQREDDEYNHRRGLITKRDLRTLSIASMRIRPTDVVWDIGAGSGAVGIEASHLAWQGKVYAIEKDEENLGFMEANRQEYSAINLEIISGEAPDALCGLPQPQAVFIGGSGGKLNEILRYIQAKAAPGCRVVCNFATLENLVAGMELMKRLEWHPSFRQASISYSRNIAGLTRLEPLNPVFILEGTRL